MDSGVCVYVRARACVHVRACACACVCVRVLILEHPTVTYTVYCCTLPLMVVPGFVPVSPRKVSMSISLLMALF